MSKPAWAAVFAAIAIPSIALLVVLLAHPGKHEQLPPPGAHPPPGAGGGPGQGAILELKGPLGLTDDQVDRIEKLAGPARVKLTAYDRQVDEKELALKDLLEQDDPDEAQVKAALDELSDLHAKRRELRVMTPLKLRKILTPEQREKLDELWQPPPPPPPGVLPPPGAPPPPR